MYKFLTCSLFFRIYHSIDGYVWTAYDSKTSHTDLGEIFERQAETTTVQLDPPIRVHKATENVKNHMRHSSGFYKYVISFFLYMALFFTVVS